MLNQNINLNNNLFDKEKFEMKATRDGYGGVWKACSMKINKKFRLEIKSN